MTESLASMTLEQLLADLVASRSLPDLEVGHLSLDARLIDAGDVFVARSGHSGHGMTYVDQARARGVAAIIHDGRFAGPLPADIVLIEMPDLDQALPTLARRRYGRPEPRLDLIAVTGTNGKSSVAWLLAQALDGAMIGTLGIGRPGRQRTASHTTPDLFTLYRSLAELADSGERCVVIEASSHALDQQRLAGLSFSSVIFTTLGHDHLDYHADRAAYARAKARLFHDYSSQRQLINIDDAFGAELAASLDASLDDRPGLIRLSMNDSDAQLRCQVLRVARAGLDVCLHWSDGRTLELQSPLLGRINAWNLLILAAELDARGLPAATIAERLAALEPPPGRMQAVAQPGACLAVIDYAHSPDALETALESLRALEPEALWCVFGCGGDRDRQKRAQMGRLAEGLADVVVLTNDNPRFEDPRAIVRAIQSGMRRPERALVQLDRARAIHLALSEAGPNDIVLVAGKGHETEQLTAGQAQPFSDLEAVRQSFEEVA